MNIQQINISKSNRQSQDITGYSERAKVYWVIDGATCPFGATASLEVNRYVELLNANLLLSSQKYSTLENILSNAISQTREVYLEVQEVPKYTPSATVAMIKVSGNSVDYLVLGDCTVAFPSKDLLVSDKRLELVAVKERQALSNLVKQKVSEDSAEYIQCRQQLVIEEQKYRNKPNGFYVAELDPEVVKYAITSSVTLEDSSDIILMSDGLSRAYECLGLFESTEELIQYIKTSGAHTLVKNIRLREEFLARKIGLPSVHDDVSFLLLTV